MLHENPCTEQDAFRSFVRFLAYDQPQQATKRMVMHANPEKRAHLASSSEIVAQEEWCTNCTLRVGSLAQHGMCLTCRPVPGPAAQLCLA